MTISLSAHRCLRKCQRQFYYRYLLASHSARDPVRHEAFILKQLNSTEAWAGNLVHRCLEEIVAPALTVGGSIDWAAATEETLRRMHRQFTFSQTRRYREPGIVKGRESDYCALLIHDGDQAQPADALTQVEETVRLAFSNLAMMSNLWIRLSGHLNYRTEDEFWIKLDDETIKVKLDLHCLHWTKHPVIVDWKCYRSMGGSDAAPQLNLYAWALLQQPNWRQFDPASMELLEVMPLSGEVKQHPFDARRLAEVDDLLFEAANEIRRVFGTGKHDGVDVADLAYANSPGTCAFCSYVEMCKGATDGTASVKPVRDSKRGQLQLFLQAG
jgi:CRISPR/Cas system-associated exonuclease Cas4 (RecB family)